MAVSIDSVYQQVLAIANREQRGYITPQEFNLFAKKAQFDIFNSYFSDIREGSMQPNLDIDLGEKSSIINDKIGPFKIYKGAVEAGTDTSNTWEFKLPDDLYHLGNVYYTPPNAHRVVSLVSTEDFHNSQFNYKTKPRVSDPVYTRAGTHEGSNISSHIRLYPQNNWTSSTSLPHFSISTVEVDYIKKPSDCNWGYVVVQEKALYNANTSVNFELHASEETSLVNKILELAGISMNKPTLAELALRNEQINETEKNK